jgi:MOSC domain-containing protein YiiM
MRWEGRLEFIHITDRGSQPMQEQAEARLIEGVGIEGDRYATGQGFYSKTPRIDRQCTLIEIETLEAILRDHQITVLPRESRRNLTTRDVPLNHLVGCEFLVGGVRLRGERLNVPCKYLDGLLQRNVFTHLLNRSGLNCSIVAGGVIRQGDVIRPA